MIHSKGLTCSYAGSAHIHFPDLTLAQGETLLLRGRSGSGKSSWLALAAALMAPAAGEIIVAGQCLGALGPAQGDAWRARHVGFLPQKLHLSTALTVADNLALVYYAAGLPVDRAAIRAALQALGVAELAARRPAQLSGGQAQRVALARAVLLQPKVILADEPTASLDDEAARDALALLQGSAQRCGATLVIATHDARVHAALPQAQVLDLDLAREAVA
ncbi:MAG: ABC transporter ATP-binding protein [Hylemonella sp.]|uniref:ABC transporter ATP-binding protein n=1 Tax=Hylemonella sp. TaxID=2066020 RepID=UPI00391A5612